MEGSPRLSAIHTEVHQTPHRHSKIYLVCVHVTRFLIRKVEEPFSPPS
jgi:hypothetical protein